METNSKLQNRRFFTPHISCIHKIANLMEFGKIILKAFDCHLGPAAPLVPGNVELRFLLIVTLQVFVH
jgi:hypothetical protein